MSDLKVTNEQIEALRAEAVQAMDDLEVALCDEALKGDKACRDQVARTIRRNARKGSK